MPVKRGSPRQQGPNDPAAVERFIAGAKTGKVSPITWRDMPEKEPRIQLNVKVLSELGKQLEYLHRRTGRSKQSLVEEALKPFLEEQLRKLGGYK